MVEYTPKSASKDIVDPIYDKKDPISASIKQRKDIGSIMSISRAKNLANDNMDGQRFFYSMSLVGTGLKNPKK
jgi:hypothetical protein